MNEAVTKRFLLCFRLMLLVWILIVNSILHVVGFEYSWLIFLSNIMLFTMEGDIKDNCVWGVDMVTFCAGRSVDNSQTEIRKNRFLLFIIVIIANYAF